MHSLHIRSPKEQAIIIYEDIHYISCRGMKINILTRSTGGHQFEYETQEDAQKELDQITKRILSIETLEEGKVCS